MKCGQCQQETVLPFRCPYCGGHFCSVHRLPENHECPRMDLARKPREDTPTRIVRKQEGHEHAVTYTATTRIRERVGFSYKEIAHLLVAATLATGVGLSMFGFQDIFVSDLLVLSLFGAAVVFSFLTHELAHKVTAQRNRLWAEFRLTPLGMLLTLLSIISPFFKVISPGAVMIPRLVDSRTAGKISISGPATNIILSIFFSAIAFLASQEALISWMLSVCGVFNAWIAFINLIPFGVLDGFKVFLWNKGIWALTFSTSLVLTVIFYTFVF